MQSRTKNVIALVLVIFAGLAIGNGVSTYLKTLAIREQNALLETRIIELKAQNALLRENKMCMADQADERLADPVCGPNPDAFLSPSPTPKTEHHHE